MMELWADRIVYALAVLLYLWIIWRLVTDWVTRFAFACFLVMPIRTQVVLLACLLLWNQTKPHPRNPLPFVRKPAIAPRSVP